MPATNTQARITPIKVADSVPGCVACSGRRGCCARTRRATAAAPTSATTPSAARPATRSANAPGANADTLNADTSASISQPTTSLMAAALMAITPSAVRVSLNSIMMRPSTGIAVIENAVATNSTKPRRLSVPVSSRGIASASSAPSANGASRPAAATAHTMRRCVRSARCEKSNSSPIWNISSSKPTCDRMFSGSAGVERNTHSKVCGKAAPNSDGPSSTPVRISPTTAAWPRCCASAPPTRAASTMIANCSSVKNSSDSVACTPLPTTPCPR